MYLSVSTLVLLWFVLKKRHQIYPNYNESGNYQEVVWVKKGFYSSLPSMSHPATMWPLRALQRNWVSKTTSDIKWQAEAEAQPQTVHGAPFSQFWVCFFFKFQELFSSGFNITSSLAVECSFNEALVGTADASVKWLYWDGRSIVQVNSEYQWVIIRDCFCVRPSLMHECVFSVRVHNRCRVASRNPLNASQTVGSVCDRELNSTDSDHSSVIPVRNTGEQGFSSYSLLLLWKVAAKWKKLQSSLQSISAISCLQHVSRRSCWFQLFQKQLMWSVATLPHSRCITCWTRRMASPPCSIHTTFSSWTVAVQRGGCTVITPV